MKYIITLFLSFSMFIGNAQKEFHIINESDSSLVVMVAYMGILDTLKPGEWSKPHYINQKEDKISCVIITEHCRQLFQVNMNEVFEIGGSLGLYCDRQHKWHAFFETTPRYVLDAELIKNYRDNYSPAVPDTGKIIIIKNKKDE